ncbi:hypothetical protein SEA_HANS_62 [Gordonia phage Hans]|nr:hypothetical protein SEA_HANS_62 [Gordonia phage Hans]
MADTPRTPPRGGGGQSVPTPRPPHPIVWRQVCSKCDRETDYTLLVTDETIRADVARQLAELGWTNTGPDAPLTVCPRHNYPTDSGGVGTIEDGILRLDYSDEATRQRALELAVEWTCRHRWPDSADTLVAVAETFRAYLADGTVPEVPK